MPILISFLSCNYIYKIYICEIGEIYKVLSSYYIKKKCYIERGRRVIWISGSLIWSKTLMELIFNPCGEFRYSPEGPVSQIHSPHLLVGAPGIF